MLEAIDLECERGGRTLFQGLSFAVPGGQALRVAGANGSGKTSLLRTLCGLLQPTAGEVRWNGSPVRTLGEDFGRQLLYLGHAPAVKDELTPAENLDIACRLAGLPVSTQQIHASLSKFGLPASSAPTKRLSQGQRRRSALARLILSAAVPLWLLDEPFSALDVGAARLVEDLIAAHVARGASVIYTTHQEVGFAASLVIEL